MGARAWRCGSQASQATGTSLGQIAAKTGIPKTSLHRYLTATNRGAGSGGLIRQQDILGPAQVKDPRAGAR
ncbi:helix-turn-helix domain-containing protein [Streptomyces lunaelactis]|uniref:helix-turn-helix domain-containing protein n=1 Tax=Streptomyces lunaelactis TaxID=1535768 RepID=UPI001C30E73E